MAAKKKTTEEDSTTLDSQAPSADAQEEKRKDAEERAEESKTRSFDENAPDVGWDAQQGKLPPEDDEDDLYRDDPQKFTEDQLPRKEVLERDGYAPVLPDHQVAAKKKDVDQDLQPAQEA